MPQCYSVFICDRSKTCLFHRDWARTTQSTADKDNDFKSLYGFFFQMGLFTSAIDPTKASKPEYMTPLRIGQGTGFRSVRTNTYQLNFYEVPSGIKIALLTSPDAGNLRPVLEELYRSVFVDHVTRDPCYLPGDRITNPRFTPLLEEFLRSHQLDL